MSDNITAVIEAYVRVLCSSEKLSGNSKMCASILTGRKLNEAVEQDRLTVHNVVGIVNAALLELNVEKSHYDNSHTWRIELPDDKFVRINAHTEGSTENIEFYFEGRPEEDSRMVKLVIYLNTPNSYALPRPYQFHFQHFYQDSVLAFCSYDNQASNVSSSIRITTSSGVHSLIEKVGGCFEERFWANQSSAQPSQGVYCFLKSLIAFFS